MDSALGRSPAESFIRIIRTSVLGAGVVTATAAGAGDGAEEGCALTDAESTQANSADKGTKFFGFIFDVPRSLSSLGRACNPSFVPPRFTTWPFSRISRISRLKTPFLDLKTASFDYNALQLDLWVLTEVNLPG